jgi:hypothetical protein
MFELEAFAGSCLLIAWRVQKPTGDYNVRDKMTCEFFFDLGNGVSSSQNGDTTNEHVAVAH